MKQEDKYELVGTIQSRFEDAETGRLPDEERWLQAYKNYRGIYDSSTQYRENERNQRHYKEAEEVLDFVCNIQNL